MRGDCLDPFGDFKAGGVAGQDEGRDAARAFRFAGAGKQGDDVGDLAVGDIGLFAIDEVIVAIFHG